jgi:hypothetical protein
MYCLRARACVHGADIIGRTSAAAGARPPATNSVASYGCMKEAQIQKLPHVTRNERMVGQHRCSFRFEIGNFEIGSLNLSTPHQS